MKRETLFLKVVIYLIGILGIVLCIFGLPWLASQLTMETVLQRFVQYPVLTALYASAVPFFFALYQTLRLLSYIDKSEAFSDLSVKSIKNIKYSAVTISIIYVIITPLIYVMAQAYDAPGILLIGLVITFASIVIAVFAAVLQKLLKNAIDIKTENDSTI